MNTTDQYQTPPTETDEVQTSVMTIRLPKELHAEIARRADMVDRSVSWFVRNALQVQLESLATREACGIDHLKPLETEWARDDERGCCGHTYELATTFVLPATDAGDLIAYDIEDFVRSTVAGAGARDICQRLISLAGMRMDTRNCLGEGIGTVPPGLIEFDPAMLSPLG